MVETWWLIRANASLPIGIQIPNASLITIIHAMIIFDEHVSYLTTCSIKSKPWKFHTNLEVAFKS